MLYMVFALGMGNIGKGPQKRRPMHEYVALQVRELPTGTSVVSFRHTGNFAVSGSLAADAVRIACKTALKDAAVLEAEALLAVLNGEHPPAPADEPCYQWTPGLAFRIKDDGRKRSPAPKPSNVLHLLNPQLACAWKKDRLTSTVVLDRKRRNGGWGGVAGDASDTFTGLWTARSLTTVSGLMVRAGQTLPRRIQ